MNNTKPTSIGAILENIQITQLQTSIYWQCYFTKLFGLSSLKQYKFELASRILRLFPTRKYLLPRHSSESNQRMSMDLQKAEVASKTYALSFGKPWKKFEKRLSFCVRTLTSCTTPRLEPLSTKRGRRKTRYNNTR